MGAEGVCLGITRRDGDLGRGVPLLDGVEELRGVSPMWI